MFRNNYNGCVFNATILSNDQTLLLKCVFQTASIAHKESNTAILTTTPLENKTSPYPVVKQ